MTKDEIAKKWGLYMPSSNTRNAMQEYADQETERLKAELVKTIETAKATSVTQRQHIERLQNELTELKERHKRYAIDFANFIALKGYTLIQKNISENGATFFIDKKSIGVNSIELYEQYYKQKFESND